MHSQIRRFKLQLASLLYWVCGNYCLTSDMAYNCRLATSIGSSQHHCCCWMFSWLLAHHSAQHSGKLHPSLSSCISCLTIIKALRTYSKSNVHLQLIQLLVSVVCRDLCLSNFLLQDPVLWCCHDCSGTLWCCASWQVQVGVSSYCLKSNLPPLSTLFHFNSISFHDRKVWCHQMQVCIKLYQ